MGHRMGTAMAGRARATSRGGARLPAPELPLQIPKETSIAEAHLSATCAAPSQKTRFPCTHEDQGWTKSSCTTSKERTSLPHGRLISLGWISRATADWSAARTSTRSTEMAVAAPARFFLFSFAPTDTRSVGSA
jgi:hypothetical protein